jgi:hypothetical protein
LTYLTLGNSLAQCVVIFAAGKDLLFEENMFIFVVAVRDARTKLLTVKNYGKRS